MQKRPVIRVLNALMACLGVAAGGLVICGLLLACVPTRWSRIVREDGCGSIQ